jgi:hypothetical protein
LNREQYGTKGDVLNVDVEEYNILMNEKDGGDRPTGEKEESKDNKTKKSVRLPGISMGLKTASGADLKKANSYASNSKM